MQSNATDARAPNEKLVKKIKLPETHRQIIWCRHPVRPPTIGLSPKAYKIVMTS